MDGTTARIEIRCPGCGAKVRIEIGQPDPGPEIDWEKAFRRAFDRLPLEDLMRPFRNPKPGAGS